MEKKTKILLVVLVGVLLFINLMAIIFIFKPSISGLTGFSVLNQKSEKSNTNDQQGSELGNKEITTPTITSRSSGGGGGSSSSSGSGSSGGGNGGGGNNPPEIVGEAKVFINPSENNVNAGKEFNIYVKIDSENEIYAVQFDLVFDKNIIEALKVEEGNFLKKDGASTFVAVNKINNTIGKISFANTRFNIQVGITGQGILALVKFKAKSSGSTTLNLEDVKISNTELQQINVSVSDGKVVVS